jgi:shikimate kinase
MKDTWSSFEMSERPVILTGFMGTGKSCVGRVLAKYLECPFVDLDAVIVADAGKTIIEIFATDGEMAFRARESDCLEYVLNNGLVVIACGGGVVIAESNRRLMREKGYVINLTAPFSVILSRLEGAVDRPLIAVHDTVNRVQELMEERKHFYDDADIRIDTGNKSVEDVATEIMRVLKGLPA